MNAIRTPNDRNQSTANNSGETSRLAETRELGSIGHQTSGNEASSNEASSNDACEAESAGVGFDVPESVRVISTLGNGRAAIAQLVDATMPDGTTVRCVEKVFAPGRLTRLIYRLSFAAPFAYQQNRDAILTSFYRRRVAASVLRAAGLDTQVAQPLYVRFDETRKAWILAAQWIQGRGIRPEPVDNKRFRRQLSRQTSADHQPAGIRLATHTCRSEIDELVDVMHAAESALIDAGLTGSGWQVAPRAMVSTANLLRCSTTQPRDAYTIIDLESGIPAVLVPKYLWLGLKRGSLPPFDDLDERRLCQWHRANADRLRESFGNHCSDQLRDDIDQLLKHSRTWKDAELAVTRRPWRLILPGGLRGYQAECLRQWRQNEIIDHPTAQELADRKTIASHAKTHVIWWASLLPLIGVFLAKLAGRRDTRIATMQWLGSADVRRNWWNGYRERCEANWNQAGRTANHSGQPCRTANHSGQPRRSTLRFLWHRVLSKTTPIRMHRFLTDHRNRREVLTTCLLLIFSRRYQAMLGEKQIRSSIDRWSKSGRIDSAHSTLLHSQLRGEEVGAYTTGLGMHLALKTLAPFLLPAKIGGVAAFLAGGSAWYLLALVATPILRTTLTIFSWFRHRSSGIPHGEALAVSWIPTLGSIAFPLQMFSARPELATFLIRDMASHLGQRLPIYGGKDSRTELALHSIQRLPDRSDAHHQLFCRTYHDRVSSSICPIRSITDVPSIHR